MDKPKHQPEDVLPIEKQKIKGKFTHVIATIPALDKNWVTSRNFGYYVFPPNKRKNGTYSSDLKEEWLTMMAFILDDIWWLCELPYHKFWSQVIFHKESMNGIYSFLHLAPLQKLYFRIEDNEILNMYKRIKRAVFQFLKRICRTKESSLHFMSEEKYQDILTTNNLIPMSLILCICSVYGKEKETEKMIYDLFVYNKSLRLDDAILRTEQLFSYVHKKMKTSYKDMKKNIEECECDDLSEILNTYRKAIVNAVQCITPAAMSISSFIFVYKDGCNLLSCFDFEYHIIRTYKKLITSLYQDVNLLFNRTNFDETRSRLITMLNICRTELLKIFNACLNYALDKMSNNRESFDVVLNYVKMMKFALKVEAFVYDFNSTYSIEGITKAFNKCNSNIDLTEVNRIQELMTESYDKLRNNSNTASNDTSSLNGNVQNYENDFSKFKLDDPKEVSTLIDNYCIDFYFNTENNSDNESVESNKSKALSDNGASSEYSDWSKNEDSGSEYESFLSNGESEGIDVVENRSEWKNSINNSSDGRKFESEFVNDQPGPSGINTKSLHVQSELEIAIDQVKDVLPHLGDGFIVMCLEHYKRDPSAVINAVLENNLASSLKSIDQNLPFIPPECLQDSTFDSGNSYAIDNNLPMKELRKVDYSNYMDMLNDKKDMAEYKNMYEKYTIVSHDVYDDDVEEDYEDDTIAALEPDPESLYINVNHVWKNKPFNKSDDESESEQSEPPAESTNVKKPLDFCENPEDVRARNDQRRRAKEERRPKHYSNRQFSSGNSTSGAANEERYYRPKAYSNNQDKQSNPGTTSDGTTRERHFKNVHKSRSANHNRRYLSDRKRRV